MKTSQSFIIKNTGDFCNLRCDYCYLGKDIHDKKRIMDDLVLKKFIKETSELYGTVKLYWEGGEPLLAGVNFYQKVVKLQKRYCKHPSQFENQFQTNGTLITQKWIDFSKKNNFKISISFDGYPEMNNLHRKNIAGISSTAAVIHSLKLLNKANYKPGCIITITRQTATVKNAQKSFHFLINKLGLKQFSINFCCDPLNKIGNKKFTVTNKQFYLFHKTIFDCWVKQGDLQIKIPFIDDMLAGLIGKTPKLCYYRASCEDMVGIDYTGIVSYCPRLPKDKYQWGDIRNQSLKDILNKNRNRDLITQTKLFPQKCKTCPWFKICHNGCLADRYGQENLYYFCKGRMQLFNYLKKFLTNNIGKAVIKI